MGIFIFFFIYTPSQRKRSWKKEAKKTPPIPLPCEDFSIPPFAIFLLWRGQLHSLEIISKNDSEIIYGKGFPPHIPNELSKRATSANKAQCMARHKKDTQKEPKTKGRGGKQHSPHQAQQLCFDPQNLIYLDAFLACLEYGHVQAIPPAYPNPWIFFLKMDVEILEGEFSPNGPKFF